jgi:hypothetical protein
MLDVQAQNVQVLKSYVLSPELHEISGIVSLDGGLSYFAVNDGGNKNQVYHLDSTGKIMRRIVVQNAANIDWEELSTDFKNYLYIADTGDNRRQRQNQKVYRLSISELMGHDSIEAEIIHICLSPKLYNKKKNKLRSYDIEAVCWKGDSLYFFSKHWKMTAKPVTHLFSCSALPGEYRMEPGDAVPYADRFFLESQITGSCVSPETGDVFWLSGTQIFQVNLTEGQISDIKSFDFDFLSQKESLCPLGGRRFAVAQEDNKRLQQPAMLHIVEIPTGSR